MKTKKKQNKTNTYYSNSFSLQTFIEYPFRYILFLVYWDFPCFKTYTWIFFQTCILIWLLLLFVFGKCVLEPLVRYILYVCLSGRNKDHPSLCVFLEGCYGLNVLPKFICQSPSPRPPPPPTPCDGIWRRGLWKVIRVRWGHEDGAPLMGLVTFLQASVNLNKPRSQ